MSKCLSNAGFVASADRVTWTFWACPGNATCCSQKSGTLPRHWTYEKHNWSEQNTVSVSTKFATLPSSSIPLALYLVPALRHERREMRVILDGKPDVLTLAGEDEGGTVTVPAK